MSDLEDLEALVGYSNPYPWRKQKWRKPLEQQSDAQVQRRRAKWRRYSKTYRARKKAPCTTE